MRARSTRASPPGWQRSKHWPYRNSTCLRLPSQLRRRRRRPSVVRGLHSTAKDRVRIRPFLVNTKMLAGKAALCSGVTKPERPPFAIELGYQPHLAVAKAAVAIVKHPFGLHTALHFHFSTANPRQDSFPALLTSIGGLGHGWGLTGAVLISGVVNTRSRTTRCPEGVKNTEMPGCAVTPPD